MAHARPTRTRLPRRLALALVGLTLALAFVTALARPAGRYFYCESMGMLPFDPCVEAPADAAPLETTSAFHALHHDCCAPMTIPPLPQGALGAAPAVPPPGLAILPAPVFASAAVAPSAATRAKTLDRRRAPPRPPGAARAALMVFLT